MSMPSNLNTNSTSSGTSITKATSTESGSLVYKNSAYGFSITHPKEIIPAPTFAHSYLLPNAWSTIALPMSSGIQIVSFMIPGSNAITSAELRISASSNRTELKNCTSTPVHATFKTSTQKINNSLFSVFEIEDAAMSHYSSIKSYRISRDSACLAVEEVITGTNPQVYDPVATAPFTKIEGFQKLDALLATFILEVQK